MINDNNTKQIVDWSSRRNSTQRLRHRPHVVNTANNRGDYNVRYFSSVDADIYFGGMFIDEVVSISWQVQQNTMPIFGYNSYTFDDIALGNRIITGQFAVNYTKANYLTSVMDSLKKISRKMYGEDLPAASYFTEPDKKRRNVPLWDGGFDLMVGYGEKKSDSYEQLIILDCCQITGCTQQLDYNGEPVIELYSFMARDMKFSDVATANASYEIEIPVSQEAPKEKAEVSLFKVNESNILINGNNSRIELDLESSEYVESIHAFIKGVDDMIFTIGKEGKISNNKIIFDLKPNEKKRLSKHCSEYGNKIHVDLKYSLEKDGQTTSRDNTIIFKTIV